MLHFFEHKIACGGTINWFVMTERMENFRLRQDQKGLVQVRLWIDKNDIDFFKYLSKESRPERVRKKDEKQRFGRPASQRQINKAIEISEIKGIKEPKHLYNHHISLCGWIWVNKGFSSLFYLRKF